MERESGQKELAAVRGRRLGMLRRAIGLRQGDIAERLGRSIAWVCRAEHGKVRERDFDDYEAHVVNRCIRTLAAANN